MARPDAHFAYCVAVNEQRLTTHSFGLLLRVRRYLVATKDMVLTFTARATTAAGCDLFDVLADSSQVSGLRPGLREHKAFAGLE